MHSHAQILETGNKQRSILFRIINVKRFLAVSSVKKKDIFKNFFVTHKLCLENVRNKRGAAEDNSTSNIAINLLYYLLKKLKNIYIVSWFLKRFHQSGAQSVFKCNYYPLNRKKMGLLSGTFPDICWCSLSRTTLLANLFFNKNF